MKGIILAAGRGSRLYPITKVINKQLLQIYDKPMIYYPLSTLMLMGIKDILIVTNSRDSNSFQALLGNGKGLGINIEYSIQHIPKGIADAFNISQNFIGNDSVTLILGDNVFYGFNFLESIRKKLLKPLNGALIFGYSVKDPKRYGVVEFDKNKNVLSIEEKPDNPKSNYAVPGLYIYDNSVVNYAEGLIPSDRGELEITDINKIYLDKNMLKVSLLDSNVTWLDTGTPTSLFEASNFISYVESREGSKIGCIEETAYTMKFIDLIQLEEIISEMSSSSYKDYLLELIKNEEQIKSPKIL